MTYLGESPLPLESEYNKYSSASMRKREKVVFEGLNFIATYTDAFIISPNLGWLELSVWHCGPRGEAIRYRRTSHQIFWIEPHDHIRPGSGAPSMAQAICRTIRLMNEDIT